MGSAIPGRWAQLYGEFDPTVLFARSSAERCGSTICVRADRRLVALTFDDGRLAPDACCPGSAPRSRCPRDPDDIEPKAHKFADGLGSRGCVARPHPAALTSSSTGPTCSATSCN